MAQDTGPFHLYRVLGVAKESSVKEITRAYRCLALQYHPDRNPDGTEQFKAISNAYALLADADRRAVYDLTGFASEAADGASKGMPDEASRQQRSAELADQVRNFFATYAGSPEESADVVKGFNTCKGNFRKMVREYLLFDNGVDGEVQRLHRLVERLIAAGKLTATEAWAESTSTRNIMKIEKAMRRERAEAEEALKELGGGAAGDTGGEEGDEGGLGALQLAIRQRQASSYQSMLDNLEAKYVTSKSGKRGADKRASRMEEANDVEGSHVKRHKGEKSSSSSSSVAQRKAKRSKA